LRIEQDELARRAKVSVVTIRRLEAPDGLNTVSTGTLEAVQRALETAGAEFVERGVRRRGWTSDEIEARYQQIKAISERSAARFRNAPSFSEDDLYDENGLPA